MASAGEEPIGWVWGHLLVRTDGRIMLLIYELDVASRHRRSGLGTELLSAMLDAGEEAGASSAWLMTDSGNQAARSLYESLGGVARDQALFWWDLPR